MLAAADVPCGPVRTRADWFGGETIAANGMRLELEHPELGTVEMPGVSLKMSGTPAITPRLGGRRRGATDRGARRRLPYVKEPWSTNRRSPV